MGRTGKKYLKISDKIRRQLEEDFYTSVIDEFRKEMMEDNYHKYEVTIQNISFVTYMTDEELRLSAKLAIDLLEELKEINNNGMDKQAFEQVLKEAEVEVKDGVTQFLGVWNRIRTDKMAELFAEIDVVRRVGGAWAALIANPGLIDAICAVYEKLVDQFDNQELYEISGYFLLRAIMRMHSDEV